MVLLTSKKTFEKALPAVARYRDAFHDLSSYLLYTRTRRSTAYMTDGRQVGNTLLISSLQNQAGRGTGFTVLEISGSFQIFAIIPRR